MKRQTYKTDIENLGDTEVQPIGSWAWRPVERSLKWLAHVITWLARPSFHFKVTRCMRHQRRPPQLEPSFCIWLVHEYQPSALISTYEEHSARIRTYEDHSALIWLVQRSSWRHQMTSHVHAGTFCTVIFLSFASAMHAEGGVWRTGSDKLIHLDVMAGWLRLIIQSNGKVSKVEPKRSNWTRNKHH